MIVQFFLFSHKDCRLFPNVDANGLACRFIRILSIGTDWVTGQVLLLVFRSDSDA